MKATVFLPDVTRIKSFLASKKSLVPTYLEREDTRKNFVLQRKSHLAKQYDYDENRIRLGEGEHVFQKAKIALQGWEMFPQAWTKIYPADAPIEVGQKVAVIFRVLGLWWLNSSEIIYTITESHCFGFAYGTLPGHVECGEEQFLVEMDEDEQVWYSIKAFSRPAYWLIRLVYPFARMHQRRFVRDSMEQMRLFCVVHNDSG